MGLSRRWASFAAGRAHALVVEVPGWWTTRVAVERAMLERGWTLALSPADADVLVECGEPGDRMARIVDRTWDQLPGPRARVAVTAEIGPALDEAARLLADDDRQRADARSRRPPALETEDGDGDGDQDEMAPAGIPLAGGGEDRDGLEMDVLHVPLGPVLPHWPAGLVLRCALHGDVVAQARVEVLAGREMPQPPRASDLPVRSAAAACDGAARLLAVAGWDDAAAASRRIRDLALAQPANCDEVIRRVGALRSRLARSWSLRWLLRGLGVLDELTVRRHGLPAEMRGDVHDRLLAMLARAMDDLRGNRAALPAESTAALTALPDVVAGLDVAAVRLVVASLAPDTAAVVRVERGHA